MIEKEVDKKEKLIIIGISTTAKQVFDFVKSYDLYEIIGFAVDERYKDKEEFCELPVYSLDKLSDIFVKEDIKIFVAVFWNRLNKERRMLYERLKKEGFQFANLISPCAVIRGNIVGDNCWIHDYVVIQSGATICENTLLMAFSLVDDFSFVGAHCFMGTKSTVAGKCIIGEQTFIGVGCTVFDNTSVGKKCILGACTIVKRNVADFSVVKTDTSATMVKQLDEEIIEEKLLFNKNKR